jgi:hypothetical protein
MKLHDVWRLKLQKSELSFSLSIEA